jgi:hypothetical protein
MALKPDAEVGALPSQGAGYSHAIHEQALLRVVLQPWMVEDGTIAGMSVGDRVDLWLEAYTLGPVAAVQEADAEVLRLLSGADTDNLEAVYDLTGTVVWSGPPWVLDADGVPLLMQELSPGERSTAGQDTTAVPAQGTRVSVRASVSVSFGKDSWCHVPVDGVRTWTVQRIIMHQRAYKRVDGGLCPDGPAVYSDLPHVDYLTLSRLRGLSTTYLLDLA